GTGINRQRQTGTSAEVVAIAVLLSEVAVPGRLAVRAAVEGDVGAQIAADLDAGIGARNVEKARPVERANAHILDRLSIDRQVGCRGCAYGEKARRRTEDKVSYRCHH